MQEKSEARAEARIRALKDQISRVGPMRPGMLTAQRRNLAGRCKTYHQVSYTFRKQSHSDYVRPADLPRVRAELKNYARFKALCEKLVAESLALSKLRSVATRNKPRPPSA